MSDKDKGTAAKRPLVRRLILAAAVLVTLAAVAAQAAVPTSQRQAGAVPGLWYWELPDTPNGLRPTQSWSGAGSAPDGAIYVGGMDHTTNAALYRLEPGGDASVPALTLLLRRRRTRRVGGSAQLEAGRGARRIPHPPDLVRRPGLRRLAQLLAARRRATIRCAPSTGTPTTRRPGRSPT